ncbi:MAG: sigma-70 family RNA polymerase sigma factor [Cyclobacteriaceae bacterium]
MQSSNEVSDLVDHFFRNEFGKAVAVLTNKYGSDMLELAEDAVQEALYKAMQTWPFQTLPDNPTGWIIRVANNKILDHLRRKDKVTYQEQIPELNEEELNPTEEEFKDDMVKMMFACCNPKLSSEYQLILTLKILGGLSVKEMASALLKKEETIAKSYTRAKKKFREENLKLELPQNAEIHTRLRHVLKVIYLLFNEGYKSTNHDQLIRKDLCMDAIRLCQLLEENENTNTAPTRSLLALMCFHSSRFDARQDENGKIIPLEKQDRTKWTNEFIERGNSYLSSVSDAHSQNEYFLQAAISGIHCNARHFNETRWDIILHLYDQLLTINANPIIALNRLVTYEKVYGPEKALVELKKIESEPSLQRNYLLPAIKSELLASLSMYTEAKAQLELAIDLTANPSEKDFLKDKLMTFDKHNLTNTR